MADTALSNNSLMARAMRIHELLEPRCRTPFSNFVIADAIEVAQRWVRDAAHPHSPRSPRHVFDEATVGARCKYCDTKSLTQFVRIVAELRNCAAEHRAPEAAANETKH